MDADVAQAIRKLVRRLQDAEDQIQKIEVHSLRRLTSRVSDAEDDIEDLEGRVETIELEMRSME